MRNAECGMRISGIPTPHFEFRTPHSMHTIRLRGPWTRQPLGGDPPVTRLARRFSRPTNLAPGQRVWLVIDETPGLVGVRLNGNVVGQVSNLPALSCPVRLEIAALLQPRNELALDQRGDDAQLGQVRLEIEDESGLLVQGE